MVVHLSNIKFSVCIDHKGCIKVELLVHEIFKQPALSGLNLYGMLFIAVTLSCNNVFCLPFGPWFEMTFIS